ncbi:TIGR03013 family XrtA/PEP-CTERM system glycosyltransferase [Desulfarculus baarsii]
MRIPSSRPSPYLVGFLLIEAGLMALGSLLAVYLRTGDTAELFTWRYSWHRVVLVPLVLQVTFYYSDLHNFRVAHSFVWTVIRVIQATALGMLALAAIYYFVPRLFLGRGVLLMSFFIIAGLCIVWRGLYKWALTRDVLSTRIILLGSGHMADCILEELTARSDNPYRVAALVQPESFPERREDERCSGPSRDAGPNLMEFWAHLVRAPLYDDPGELLGLVRHHQADMIVVAMAERRQRTPLEELLRCRMAGVPVLTGEDFYEQIAGRILAERINPSWLIYSTGFRTSLLRLAAKRAMDLLLAALGLILSAPLTLLVALAVRLDSKGPIIYRQERVGQNNRVFTILKFRSMTVGAEDGSGPVWAQENDPRVTRVGRIIRVLRLDEIPQMWNVLRGDMSFVGPRPERPVFVEQLSAKLPYYRQRHNIKPGITGWAQLCHPYGASVAAALEKLNYDLYYIKHTNLTLDIQIIIQTVKVMITGGGGQ